MNFIAKVEEHLRDLGTEARKKHPGVKEASERAILTLRRLQSQYVSAVRASSSGRKQTHPTTSLFRSQDVLRPFLLACNYPDASPRLLNTGLNAIQLLINGDAICPSDSVHIARILAIQASCCCNNLSPSSSGSTLGSSSPFKSGSGAMMMSAITSGYSSSGSGAVGRSVKDDEAISLKVLQTLTMVMASRELELGEEVLSQALAVCLTMIAGNPASIGGLASGGTGGRHQKLMKRSISGGSSGAGGGAGSGGSSGMIRRAAVNTLRQIISITFDRAASVLSENFKHNTIYAAAAAADDDSDALDHDASSKEKEEDKPGSPDMQATRHAAAKAFADLCTLSENHAEPKHRMSHGTSPRSEVSGPFSMGLGAGQHSRIGRIPPPPRSTCFELLDMILLQRPSLFISKKKPTSTLTATAEATAEAAPTEEKQASVNKENMSEEFPNLLRNKLCPLVATFLLSECSPDDASKSDNFGRNLLAGPSFPTLPFSSETRDSDSSLNHGNKSVDFALLKRGVRLASTIVSKFGKTEELGGECHILLMSLVRFVSKSTEAYRDADNFEDGYVYSSSSSIENDSQQIQAHGWRAALGNDPSNISPTCLISNNLLWRSALALEALYFITSGKDTICHLHTSYDGQRPHTSIVAVIAEAVSDFATIAASNKHSIFRVVDAVEERESSLLKDDESDGTFSPQVFARAIEFIKSYDEWDPDESPNQNTSINGHSIISTHSHSNASSYGSTPPCDEGEAILIAFNCTLSLVKSIESHVHDFEKTENDDISSHSEARKQLKSLVNCTFAPSLAVLQHFLKRFPGSKTMLKSTLAGYTSLANASIPLSQPEEMQRKAILTSLCKLSIPAWGKTDSSCQLKDHNIESLCTLFRIVHSNHNRVMSDWYMILCTLEQLSSLSISSTKLSDDSYETAMCISKMFTRISSFSTCLSSESLVHFVEALVTLSASALKYSETDGTKKGKVDRASSGAETSDGTSVLNEDDENTTAANSAIKESIGGKLMSLAGRAFAGVGSTSGYEHDGTFNDTPVDRVHSSKTFSEDYRQEVFRHLAVTKPTTRKEIFQKLPFSLIALTDTTLFNSYRFPVFGKTVTSHLCDLSSSSFSAGTRSYAMDTLSTLITSRLSGSKDLPTFGIGQTIAKPSPSLDDYLSVDSISKSSKDSCSDEPKQPGDVSPLMQSELLAPLCQTIATTDQTDTAEAGLNALHVVLEGAGHNLEGDAWPILISAISALTGDTSMNNESSVDRSKPAWVTCCTLAFRCLKLIVDDFLDQLPSPPDPLSHETRSALLDCCASFGSSAHDVNTSLTATGMLWTIADSDSSPSSVDHVLSKLAFLASDCRAEVRNCSVNTLFSCVVGLGHRFSAEQWRECLVGTIFGVLDQVACQGGEKQDPNTSMSSTTSGKKKDSSRYPVTVHHTRDSVGKQWATTQVLTLRGLERVLRQFFSKLLASTVDNVDYSSKESQGESSAEKVPWFEVAWERIVEHAFRCACLTGGRETLDLRQAGIDILVLSTQLSCRGGITAAAAPVRVGTNMQVINGALRSVDTISESPSTPSSSNIQNDASASTSSSDQLESRRQHLFQISFNILERFTIRLNDGNIQDQEESQMFIETTLLQVLTKLSHGLTKLYECCKDHELSCCPAQYSLSSNGKECVTTEVGDDYEGRFVAMVYSVAINAMPDARARYLTQAQRASLDLLRSMASCSSSKAFHKLANTGGKAFFSQYSCDDDDDEDDDDDLSHQSDVATELLEYEAAKAVADLFVKEGVPNMTKTFVLSTILGSFLEGRKAIKLSEKSGEDSGDDDESSSSIYTPACYDLLVPVVTGGIDSSSLLENEETFDSPRETEQKTETKKDRSEITALLETLWDRVVSALAILLSPMEILDHNSYTSNTDNILQILSCSISHAPQRIYPDLGVVLSKGASQAIEIAKSSTESNSNEHFMDALKVFEACFVNLSQCQPKSSELRSIAEKAIRETLEAAEARTAEMQDEAAIVFNSPLSLYRNNSDNMENDIEAEDETEIDIDVEVTLIVCETVRTSGPSLSDIAIAIFPLLCKLTNTDNSRLRRKAGEVLSGVNVGEIISNGKAMADAAEERAIAAEQKNTELIFEVEKLQIQNENLQRQITGT